MTPEQLASRLAAVASEFKPATQLLREVGRVTRVAIKEQVRRKAYRTGRLHDSVIERVAGDTLMVEATAPYAGFVNDGTRYMEGRHFMEGGLEDAVPEIERVMQDWGDTVFGKVAG